MRIISNEFANLLANMMAEAIILITLFQIIAFFLKSTNCMSVNNPCKMNLVCVANIKYVTIQWGK